MNRRILFTMFLVFLISVTTTYAERIDITDSITSGRYSSTKTEGIIIDIDDMFQELYVSPVNFCVAASDEETDLTTGTSKVTFRTPYAFTLTEVRLSVNTAPTGSTIIVDVSESGASVFSTLPSIDTSEKTSTSAAVPAVISDSSIADDAEIIINVTQVGSTTAGKGLKIWFIGHRSL